MSKKKLNKPMPDQGVASARARRKDGGTRETVESIAIAFGKVAGADARDGSVGGRVVTIGLD